MFADTVTRHDTSSTQRRTFIIHFIFNKSCFLFSNWTDVLFVTGSVVGCRKEDSVISRKLAVVCTVLDIEAPSPSRSSTFTRNYCAKYNLLLRAGSCERSSFPNKLLLVRDDRETSYENETTTGKSSISLSG